MAKLSVDNKYVDFYTDEHVKLTQSLDKLISLEGVYSEFTKEFTVPATKNNNNIFSYYTEVDVIVPPHANPHRKIEAVLILEDVKEILGVIEINGTTYKAGKPDSYSIIFYGNLVNLKSQLEAVNLNDSEKLDLSSLNFTYTYSNITGSWVGTPDVMLPIFASERLYFYDSNEKHVDGEYNPDNIAVVAEKPPSQSHIGGITWADQKPAYLLSNLVELVLQNADFDGQKYNVTWGSKISTYINSLYLQPAGLPGQVENKDVNSLFYVTRFGSDWFYTNTNVFQQLEFTVEEYDNNNDFDLPTNTFIPAADGLYDFQTDIEFGFDTHGAAAKVEVTMRIKAVRGGVNFYYPVKQTIEIPAAGDPPTSWPINWTGIRLEASDEVTIEISFDALNNIKIIGQWWKLVRGGVDIINKTITPSGQFPDISCYEFISKFLATFNLVLYQDGRDLLIDDTESFFSGSGSPKDWTRYVDISNISSRKVTIPKKYIFKFTEAKDFRSVTYRNTYKKDFGEFSRYSQTDFGKEEEIFESIFTTALPDKVYKPIRGQVNIPMVYGLSDDYKPVMNDMVLFFYSGLKTVDQYRFQDGVELNGNNRFEVRDTIPMCQSWFNSSSAPSINQSDKFISFSVENGYPYDDIYVFPNNIYELFHRDWLYRKEDKSTRTVTFNGTLPISEYNNFNLYDKIQIDGAQYIINSISYDILDETVQFAAMTYDNFFETTIVDSITPTGVATLSQCSFDGQRCVSAYTNASAEVVKSYSLKKYGGDFVMDSTLLVPQEIFTLPSSPKYREPVISGGYEGGVMSRTLAATFTGISDWVYAGAATPPLTGQFSSDNADPNLITTITIHQNDSGATDREAELDKIQVGMQLLTVGIISGLNNIYEVTAVKKSLPLYDFDVTLVSTQETYSAPNTYTFGYKAFSTDQIIVTAGSGVISDNTTNPQNPVFTQVSWEETTITVSTPLDTGANLIYTDETGVVQQALGGNTREERRGRIIFGIAYYSIIPPSITPEVIFLQDLNYTISQQGSMLLDYINFKPIGTRKDGLFIRKIPFDLNIWTTAGEVFIPFIEWSTNRKDPNILPLPQVGDSTTRAEFKVILQDGTIPATPYLEIPKQWDNGTSTPQPISGARAVIHYIYISPAGEVWLQLGQTEYLSYTDALDSAFFDASEQIQADLVKLMIPLGQVVLNNAAADFEDPDRATIINFTQIAQTIGAV